MTANRLPNHVTPTNKVFPIVSVACAITSIWDKGVHVRRILQEFGKKFQIFLHFYSKDGKLFKRFVFCYRENLILVGNIVQKVQKSPTKWSGINGCWVLLLFVHVVNLISNR